MFIISQLWLTSHPRSTVVLLDTVTPGTSTEIHSEDANDGTRTRNPSVIKRVLYWVTKMSSKQLKSYCWEGVESIQLVYFMHHCMFIISQLWLTSDLRSTVVLLDTGTPGTSREIYSEDADDGTRTRNP